VTLSFLVRHCEICNSVQFQPTIKRLFLFEYVSGSETSEQNNGMEKWEMWEG